ncbi:copine-8-like [Hetaerina americana]|uniref:copine-8-like n=1 Tax=Hetaerina americana TaxID=62018 RepID=UPI003A7F36DA
MPFVPGTAELPTLEVELSISCRSLRGKDVLSKSDPIVVVYCNPFGEKRWVEFGRTEAVQNAHDPDFMKKIVMTYQFEVQQPLLFKVFDVDSSSSSLEDHDFLGEASCSLAQIISCGKLQLGLKKHESDAEGCGYIVLSTEELSQVTDIVVLQFQGSNLDKKKFLGKSDPCLVFMKAMESGDFNVVHRTEVIKGTVDPYWQKFCIPVRNLCNGDFERTIKASLLRTILLMLVEICTRNKYGFTQLELLYWNASFHCQVVCYDWNSNGNNIIIGEFETTLKELSQGPGSDTVYQLINKKKQLKKKDSYRNSGIVSLTYLDIQKPYSFLDYIKGGTQINCSFAIDFTGSNGKPTSSHSLHFLSSMPNSYEIAIQSVGNIIKDYDSDQLFPVLGFGASIPPQKVVSQEFFVNLTQDDPYCKGIEGVLTAYRNCLRQVKLSGPSDFAPVINHVANFAMACRDGTNYFILLLMTDGYISDMRKTKQLSLPVSSFSKTTAGVTPFRGEHSIFLCNAAFDFFETKCMAMVPVTKISSHLPPKVLVK